MAQLKKTGPYALLFIFINRDFEHPTIRSSNAFSLYSDVRAVNVLSCIWSGVIHGFYL